MEMWICANCKRCSTGLSPGACSVHSLYDDIASSVNECNYIFKPTMQFCTELHVHSAVKTLQYSFANVQVALLIMN